MTRSDVKNLLIAVVCQIQKASGREVFEISGDTIPIRDLPGFDSLNGAEVTVEISTKLGKELKVSSVLVADGKFLSINEAATLIAKEII
jgi:acyl carrier protein